MAATCTLVFKFLTGRSDFTEISMSKQYATAALGRKTTHTAKILLFFWVFCWKYVVWIFEKFWFYPRPTMASSFLCVSIRVFRALKSSDTSSPIRLGVFFYKPLNTETLSVCNLSHCAEVVKTLRTSLLLIFTTIDPVHLYTILQPNLIHDFFLRASKYTTTRILCSIRMECCVFLAGDKVGPQIKNGTQEKTYF